MDFIVFNLFSKILSQQYFTVPHLLCMESEQSPSRVLGVQVKSELSEWTVKFSKFLAVQKQKFQVKSK